MIWFLVGFIVLIPILMKLNKDGIIKLPEIKFESNSAKDHSVVIKGDNNKVSIKDERKYIDNSVKKSTNNTYNYNTPTTSTSSEDPFTFFGLALVGIAFLILGFGLYLKIDLKYNLKLILTVITISLGSINILVFYFRYKFISLQYIVFTLLLVTAILTSLFRVIPIMDSSKVEQMLLEFATEGNNLNIWDFIGDSENSLQLFYLLSNVTMTYILILFLLFETFDTFKRQVRLFSKDSVVYVSMISIVFLFSSGLIFPIGFLLRDIVIFIFSSIGNFFKDLFSEPINKE